MEKMNLISLRIAIILCCAGCSAGCHHELSSFYVNSPSEELSVRMDQQDGKILYTVLWKGNTLIHPSQLSIFPGVAAEITDVGQHTENSIWKPVWGQFSEINNYYNELVLDVQYGQVKTQLFVRVFDQGLGFQYALEGQEEGKKATFQIEYQLDPSDSLYTSVNEHEPIGPIPLDGLKSTAPKSGLLIPLVVEKSGKPYLSILESDLISTPGFGVMRLAMDTLDHSLFSANSVSIQGDQVLTPWRVILVNENLGDLVTNTVPLNLATPSQLDDLSWITPGKTLWDWRVHGYTTEDGFTYGINTESYLRFIDFAAEKGIEYFLIDDSWYKEAQPGHFELSDQLDLQQVIDYAKAKEVDLLLYYDRRHGEYGDEELFQYYQSLGIKGIKYGFMGPKVPFTRDAITASAENQLLIDFHDRPVPLTGVERTFPNAITKEYCHAQQDSRKAFTPESFIKMALINAIQGPLDMNNGNFDLAGINRGDREKGPKIADSYLSTVVSEAARTLVIYSGLVCIPDAPEAYRQKADLFEFIQKLPIGRWDESRVLHAKMGEYISTARRQGDSWFIGSVHDQQGGTLEIVMDFLKPGREYMVTYYEDTDETHGQTNPEAYRVRTGKLKKGDIVQAKMAPGGGHCMWIR